MERAVEADKILDYLARLRIDDERRRTAARLCVVSEGLVAERRAVAPNSAIDLVIAHQSQFIVDLKRRHPIVRRRRRIPVRHLHAGSADDVILEALRQCEYLFAGVARLRSAQAAVANRIGRRDQSSGAARSAALIDSRKSS